MGPILMCLALTSLATGYHLPEIRDRAAPMRVDIMEKPPPSNADLVDLDPSMQVGVADIDGQHLTLIRELNCLIADTQAAPSSEIFSDVLCRLGRELSDHFSFEEQVFIGLGMPAHEVDAHVAAHSEILDQYTDLNLDLMRLRAVSRADALRMIRHWVVDHIVTHDVRIRCYLSA
jgi:hemerythrin-like metal-binding protein